MFMAKRRKMYNAYVLITEYVRETTIKLQNMLYDPDDEYAPICCSAAVLLYLGFIFNASAHISLYMFNFAEKPEIQKMLSDGIDELNDYINTTAAKQYYTCVFIPDPIGRMIEDAYNPILDRHYCALIYAIQRYSDNHFCEYDKDIDLDTLPDTLYRFFVAHEVTAKPLVEKVRALYR